MREKSMSPDYLTVHLLSSFLSKTQRNDTLYVENSVDASTKEVY
jgi:hypothetical protein